jgi:hypothetical protein
MRPFRLADTARVCVSDQGSVFLNIERDTYTGIDARQSRALASMVEGWPDTGGVADPEDDSLSLAHTLRDLGLLAVAPDGHAVEPSSLPTATEELISWADMAPPRIRLAHVLLFLRALFVALFLRHLRPFSASVRHFTRRQTRFATIDIAFARELLSVYTYVRMFVFARRERCLLDSMVLVEFLASFNVFPQWVIGVQVRPFGAHSWVQHEHRVLNGTTGFVRAYRPILVV